MSFLNRLGADLNPFDGPKAPIRTPAPVQQQSRAIQTPAPGNRSTISPQAQAALQHPNFVQRGLQAPGATQAFINQSQTPKFNPLKALPGAAASAVNQQLVQPFVVEPTKAVYDMGRGAVGSATSNQQAVLNANKAKATDYPQVLNATMFSPRSLVQAAETIVHPFSTHTVTPQSQVEQQILGQTPIQNIQAGVKTNYQQHHNVALAGLYGTGQVAQDALMIAGLKGGLKTGINKATPVVNKVTEPLQPKYAGLPKSQIIMDTNKLNTLHNAKNYDPFEPGNSTKAAQDIITGLHQIKNDHGLDFITGSPEARQQRISQYLEQNGEAIPQLQAHQAKVANIRNKAIDAQNKFAPGLRTSAVDENGNQLGLNGKPLKAPIDPLAALKQEALKYKSADEFISGVSQNRIKTQKIDAEATKNLPFEKVTQEGELVPGVKISDVENATQQGWHKTLQDLYNQAHAEAKSTAGSVAKSLQPKLPGKAVAKSRIPAKPAILKESGALVKDNLPGIGSRIKAADRGNIGTIVGHNSDGSARVQFINRKEGTKFTKTMQPHEMATLNGKKLFSNQPLPASRTGRTQIQESVNPKPLSPESVASLPRNRTTTTAINTDRLNTTDAVKKQLSADTQATVEKMSNQDVVKIAKSAGIDTRSHTIQQTRQQIAEQLNVRQNALRLQTEAEVARQAGNTEKAAQLLKASAEMARTSRTQGTDLARQLQARRILANDLNTPQQRLFKLLDNAGVNPDVYTKRLAEVDFANPDEVVAAYRDLVPAKFGDWLDKYRYSNMLSSPMTHAVNISGNLEGGAIVRPVQKLFEGGVDAVHHLATGAPRTRYAGEAGSYAKGYIKSVPEGFRAFGEALSGKHVQDNPEYGNMANAPLAVGGLKGTTDKILSFIPKLLEATDEGFQANIRGAESKALDYRLKKGVAVTDKEGLAQEAADYTLFRQELGNAKEGHFLNAVDYIPRQISEARNSANPVVRTASKLIFPFVKTGTNISKQMIEYSPLGVTTLPGHLDKTAQIAKAVMGTTLTGVAAGYLAADNKLTFAAPTDAKEKQKFLAEGKQAYSVKIGNKWYSYQRIHPALSFQLAAVAAVNDSLRNKKMNQSTADSTLNGLASISRFFIDQSYFKNAQDFLNNASGTGSLGQQGITALASQGSNIANQFVPARAAQTWLNNFIDQVQRQPDSSASALTQFKQQFSSQLPGLSKSVPARTDNLGNPLKKPNPIVNNLSPVRVSNEKNDSSPGTDNLSKEVDRLSRQDNSIALSKQTASQKIAGTDVTLNPKQTQNLTNTVNKFTKDGWNKIITTPEYKALNDEDKRHALSTFKTDATSAAKRQFATQNNIDLKDKASSSDVAILDNNVDYTKYIKAKNGQGKYATATGTPVAKSLPEDSKKILTHYNAMSAAERDKATRTQPDFEYKYLKAKYDNDKANGLNSAPKEIAAQKEIAKAKVGSTYSHEVRDLHDKLNASDLYTYLSTPEKGKDKQKIANDILAYDNALTDAGLQTKGKFHDKYGNSTLTAKNSSGKYGVKTKSSSGSRKANISGTQVSYKGLKSASAPKFHFKNTSGKSSGKVKLASYKTPKTTIKKPKVLRGAIA